MTTRRPANLAAYAGYLLSRNATPEFLEAQVLEVREDATTGARQIVGLALPYGEELERMDWLTGATRQVYDVGCATVRDNATLWYGHDHLTRGLPVGRIASWSNTPRGLEVVCSIARTPKGDEVYELVRPDEDGHAVLDRFSVGYYPVASSLEEQDTSAPLLRHTEIDVFEVSVTHDPAFPSAVVENVLHRQQTRQAQPRQEGTTMTEAQRRRLAELRAMATLSAERVAELGQLAALEAQHNSRPGLPAGAASAEDVRALTESIGTLERQVATLGAGSGGDDGAETVPYASYGGFVRALAAGEDQATQFLERVAELLDFDPETGGTTADLGDVMRDSWVGERFREVEASRTLLNFFARSVLPASGMNLEYGVEGTDTTAVAEQLEEGDQLVKGKVTFDTATAPIRTYGGWGDMSRQHIERSPINVVERFMNALLRRYARETEARVNLRALAAGQALTGGVLDLETADGWTLFVIRAARVLKDTGYPIEGILVGHDVFEDVALMRVSDAPDAPYFLNRSTGTINVTGLAGEMFNLPVIPIATGATNNVVRAANTQAIRTYEAGGAPFRLQDDDITRLTKAFSIYGYMADVTEVPGAIVKPQAV